MAYYLERKENERLQTEVARLREALCKIYSRADIQADEPIVEICEAALSTPADDWLEQHDAERDAKICELGNEVIRLTKLVARQRLEADAVRELNE